MEFIYFSYLPQNSSNSTMNKKDSKLSKNYFMIHCSIKTFNYSLLIFNFQLKNSSIAHFPFSTFNFPFSIKQLSHWSFSIFNFQFSIKEVFHFIHI